MKIVVIVDVSNLYYTVRKVYGNAKVDYEKLLDRVVGERVLQRAIAYGITLSGGADAFEYHLKKIGFSTKFKAPKIWYNEGQSKPSTKADWDVEMAIDMIRHIEKTDIIVLCSADGDLAPCVQYVRDRGVRVEVVACQISKDLKAIVDFYEEIGPDLLIQSMETENAASTL